MNLRDIRNVPPDCILYAHIVMDFRPPKKDPIRVCITVGRNLIAYSDELTTITADLTCSKIL